jgi:hypothetical protein
MRIKEFLQSEQPPSVSEEDEMKILKVIEMGEAAWSKPMPVEDAIRLMHKAVGVPYVAPV